MSLDELIKSCKPVVMGVLNVTPDSFSDGGKFADKKSAVAQALSMVSDGADIIDIGGESTRPGSDRVKLDDELRRVIPVIEGIRKKSNIPISIDTTKSRVASEAIRAGADMINDISAGRFDPQMFETAVHANVPMCLMHMRGTPKTMQAGTSYANLMAEIRSFLEDAVGKARKAGVRDVVIDPGIGFGKTAKDNVEILRRIGDLVSLGLPILVGTSRKSFIGNLLGHSIENRLEATLATIFAAHMNGATWFRVHDTGPARRFLDAVLMMEAS